LAAIGTILHQISARKKKEKKKKSFFQSYKIYSLKKSEKKLKQKSHPKKPHLI